MLPPFSNLELEILNYTGVPRLSELFLLKSIDGFHTVLHTLQGKTIRYEKDMNLSTAHAVFDMMNRRFATERTQNSTNKKKEQRKERMWKAESQTRMLRFPYYRSSFQSRRRLIVLIGAAQNWKERQYLPPLIDDLEETLVHVVDPSPMTEQDRYQFEKELGRFGMLIASTFSEYAELYLFEFENYEKILVSYTIEVPKIESIMSNKDCFVFAGHISGGIPVSVLNAYDNTPSLKYALEGLNNLRRNIISCRNSQDSGTAYPRPEDIEEFNEVLSLLYMVWLSCNALNNTLTDYLMNDATQLWNDTSSFMMRFRHILHETERVNIAGRWYPKYELSSKRQRTLNS